MPRPRKYSRVRRRSSKKRNKTKKKSKKMRGGVTRKLLTRRKVADLTREIGLGHGGSLNTRIKEFVRPALTNQSIRYAVQHYLAGGARKKRIVDKYGEISKASLGVFGVAAAIGRPRALLDGCL